MMKPPGRPHFLICIGGEAFSEDTIRFGARCAAALEADISVLYVAPATPHAMRDETRLVREKLRQWEIDHPGVRVLRYAREVLASMGLVATDITGDIVRRHELRPGINGAYELHLVGGYGEEVRLRMREGKIVEEIVHELEARQYTIVVVGAPRKRRLLHEIVQFANASVLVAKNAHRDYYDLLLPMDDSEAARRARDLAGIAARALNLEVVVLSVAETDEQREQAQALAEHEAGHLRRRSIRAAARSAVGDVVEEICRAAGDDHIIVLGGSRQHQLWMYLFGNRPIRVVQRAQSPVLVVK
jgi:nucleotide-binding universal stress UspA family protein